MKTLTRWLNEIMTQDLGVGQEMANAVDGFTALAILIIICIGVNWIFQVLYRWISARSRIIRNSRWHKFLERRKLGPKIILFFPGILFYIGVWFLFDKGSQSIVDLHRYCIIYFVAVLISLINSGLLSFLDSYSRTEKNKSHPLKGIIQSLQVIVYFIGGIIIVSLLINKSPVVLLTGLGASAAVLMLIFKDSILGLVAGVQMSSNNMIRIGDWIQMPDGSANGIVEEITLNTVKVRNWDNTLTMIPPYTLVSTPFKNWRGMQESAGRRVDKCIFADINSLEIYSEDKLKEITGRFPIMKEYFNENSQITNMEAYRAYIKDYLMKHPEVNTDLDLIVTQKEATVYGIPIEIYFFLKDKSWASYEKKQSDIFTHLMSIAPEFGIRMYQRP